MTPPSLTARAFAKINLYLKILRRRPDGYHDIETLFERVSLFDTLSFHAIDEDRITLTYEGESIPTDARNIIIRAARAIKPFRRRKTGVAVHVIKRIPVAAGLGGGSSDAAATLTALNKLWRCGLSHEQLVACGRRLGADVPFFLHNASWAWGKGRGDEITPLPLRWRLWHVIVTPCVRLSTRQVYAQVASLSLTKKRLNVKILTRFGGSRSPGELLQIIARNDLTQAAVRRCPSLHRLLQFGERDPCVGVVFVSGSGPSVVMTTQDRQNADKIAGQLKRRYRRVWVVTTQ